MHLWAAEDLIWGVKEDELYLTMPLIWSQWKFHSPVFSLLRFQSAARGFTHAAFHDIRGSPGASTASQAPSRKHKFLQKFYSDHTLSEFAAATPVIAVFCTYRFAG